MAYPIQPSPTHRRHDLAVDAGLAPEETLMDNAETSDSAPDTHITINQPPPHQPRPAATKPPAPPAPPKLPELAPLTPPVPKGHSAPRYSDAKRDDAEHEESDGTINWGAVRKGAVIITAVAVVGVAAYFTGGAIAAWALENAAVNSFAGTVVAPIVTGVETAGIWLVNFVPAIVTVPLNFITGAAAGLGLTTATVATTAGSGAAGSLLAGAAMGGSAMVAAPEIANLNLVNHHSPTTIAADHAANQALNTPASADLPDVHHEGNLLTNWFNKTGFAGTPDLAHHTPTHAEHVEHATHSALEVSHHAAHHKLEHDQAAAATAETTSHTDAGDNSTQTEPPVESAPNLTKRARPANWSDRVGGSNADRMRASIPAARKPTSFAQQINEDRAKLDAALSRS